MHAIIGTVLKKWMQQERCQKYSTEQVSRCGLRFAYASAGGINIAIYEYCSALLKGETHHSLTLLLHL